MGHTCRGSGLGCLRDKYGNKNCKIGTEKGNPCGNFMCFWRQRGQPTCTCTHNNRGSCDGVSQHGIPNFGLKQHENVVRAPREQAKCACTTGIICFGVIIVVYWQWEKKDIVPVPHSTRVSTACLTTNVVVENVRCYACKPL